MKRTRSNLDIASPKCRCCGRFWRPPSGVSASQSYCKRCSKQRREQAEQALGLKKPTKNDFSGPYLLPRRFRSA